MLTQVVEIPRGSSDAAAPCWIPIVARKGNGFAPAKPLIKCRCGAITGIALHHVQADGLVTASYWHAESRSFEHCGKVYEHTPGCGWHVYLKLLDYDQGDFPPQI